MSGIGATTAPLAAAAPAGDPSVVGEWSAPFEEGGAETPRCVLIPNDSPNDDRERLQCKPAAVTTAVLPDGRFLYGNGIESEENAEEGAALSLSPEDRDSRFRVLDLRDGTPSWTTPENETGGGVNNVIEEGRTSDDCLTEHPLGVAGVPGRPGDGFVGSLAGTLGVPEEEPTCAPDDVQANDTDIFCGDIAQMADGRLMLIGGTDWYNEPSILERADGDPINVGVVELEGLRQARIFDHTADDGAGDWAPTGDMKYGRWYPTNVTSADGKQLAFSGTVKLIKSTQLSQVRRVESYDPATEVWTEEFSGPQSEKTLPQNSRIFISPNGKPFYAGHGQMWGPFGQSIDEALFGMQGFFNTETDSWEAAGGLGVIPRSSPATSLYPISAPYDEIKIFSLGGTFGPPPGSYIATNTTELTTVNADGTVTNEMGPPAIHPRWFGNATPLPNGQILFTGGALNDEVIFPGTEVPVVEPELYDPETGEFTAMATPERIRTYHNSASLLPNGQVIFGGNSPISLGYGIQRDAGFAPFDANNDKDSSFELFDPPYLHKGDRPSISSAPAGLAWDDTFEIESDDASDIERVTLMRTPSIQHVHDPDARTLILDFEQTGPTTLEAIVPPQNAAIPGYYYLFINKGDGSSEIVELDGDDFAKKGKDSKGGHESATPAADLVPSTARMILVGAESDDSEAPEPMPSTEFEGNGATPEEDNTILNNKPNFGESPTIPGESDPLIPGLDGAEAPAAPELGAPAEGPSAPADLPSGSGLPEGTMPSVPLGGSLGRRGSRINRRFRLVG